MFGCIAMSLEQSKNNCFHLFNHSCLHLQLESDDESVRNRNKCSCVHRRVSRSQVENGQHSVQLIIDTYTDGPANVNGKMCNPDGLKCNIIISIEFEFTRMQLAPKDGHSFDILWMFETHCTTLVLFPALYPLLKQNEIGTRTKWNGNSMFFVDTTSIQNFKFVKP